MSVSALLDQSKGHAKYSSTTYLHDNIDIFQQIAGVNDYNVNGLFYGRGKIRHPVMTQSPDAFTFLHECNYIQLGPFFLLFIDIILMSLFDISCRKHVKIHGKYSYLLSVLFFMMPMGRPFPVLAMTARFVPLVTAICIVTYRNRI